MIFTGRITADVYTRGALYDKIDDTGGIHMGTLNEKKISDDMLDNVNGGILFNPKTDEDTISVTCNHCFDTFRVSPNKKPVICPSCKKEVQDKLYSGPAGRIVSA